MESTWIEITFAMDPDEYRLLKRKAEELELTVPSLLRRNIADFLKREEEAFRKNEHLRKF